MDWLDMHSDTLMLILDEDKEPNLYENDIHIDFQRMKEGNYLAQFFAIFMLNDEKDRVYKGKTLTDWEYIDLLRSFLLEEVGKHEELIKMAYSLEDIYDNEKNGIMSALLALEDGRPVEGKMENIDKLYDLGFRLITLTWNYENSFGYPNSKDKNIMNKGLKDFGKEAILYMNEKGIIIDVSHLSDGGFWDIVEISKKPFIASHSNARALTPHTRNLTDDMIKALSEAGGITGINFAPMFLTKDMDKMEKLGRDKALSEIDDIIRHMKHIKNIGGIDCLAMGTDFDGIGGVLEVSGAEKMPILIDAMEKNGFTSKEIDKVTRKNAERVLKDIL